MTPILHSLGFWVLIVMRGHWGLEHQEREGSQRVWKDMVTELTTTRVNNNNSQVLSHEMESDTHGSTFIVKMREILSRLVACIVETTESKNHRELQNIYQSLKTGSKSR